MDKYFTSAVALCLCYHSVSLPIILIFASHLRRLNMRAWQNMQCTFLTVLLYNSCYSVTLTSYEYFSALNVSCGFLKHRKLLTEMVKGNNNEIIIVLFMIALVEYRYYKPRGSETEWDVNVWMFTQLPRQHLTAWRFIIALAFYYFFCVSSQFWLSFSFPFQRSTAIISKIQNN